VPDRISHDQRLRRIVLGGHCGQVVWRIHERDHPHNLRPVFRGSCHDQRIGFSASFRDRKARIGTLLVHDDEHRAEQRGNLIRVRMLQHINLVGSLRILDRGQFSQGSASARHAAYNQYRKQHGSAVHEQPPKGSTDKEHAID